MEKMKREIEQREDRTIYEKESGEERKRGRGKEMQHQDNGRKEDRRDKEREREKRKETYGRNGWKERKKEKERAKKKDDIVLENHSRNNHFLPLFFPLTPISFSHLLLKELHNYINPLFDTPAPYFPTPVNFGKALI